MGSLAAKTILRAYGWWLTIRCKMGSSRSSRTQPMLEVPGRPKYVGKGSFVSGAWAAAQGRQEAFMVSRSRVCAIALSVSFRETSAV